MTNTEITTTTPNDVHLIAMWVHGKSRHTQRAYRHDVGLLMTMLGKGIQSITLSDLQSFGDSLIGKDTTRARTYNSIKSLLTFAHTLGYVSVNVGKAWKAPIAQEHLAQRIMEEADTIRLIDNERDARNHTMLRLLYHCGMRVSEVVSLRWVDLTPRKEGGQVSIFGKGSKTRQVCISLSMWHELLGDDATLLGTERYIFQSRKSNEGTRPMDTSQVNRIVERAAIRVGIAVYTDDRGRVHSHVSPHWLRHAHASHSLDRGASINLVRETLGHASIATTGKYTHARPSDSSSRYLPL